MTGSRFGLAQRRIALSAAAVFALSRAWAYSPWTPRSGLVQEPILLVTADGRLLGAYAALWAVAGGMCLIDLRTGRIIRPLAWICALMVGWGVAWGIGWALTPDSTWWQTALTYLCPGIIIAALVLLTPHTPEEPPPGGADDSHA